MNTNKHCRRERQAQHLLGLAISLLSACTSLLGIEEKRWFAAVPCKLGSPANNTKSPNCTNLDFANDTDTPEQPFGFFCASQPEGTCARVISASDTDHALESRLERSAIDGRVTCKQVLEEDTSPAHTLDVTFTLDPPDTATVYWFGLFSEEAGQKELALSSNPTQTFVQLGAREERLLAAPAVGTPTRVQILIRNTSKTLDLFYDDEHLCPGTGDCSATAHLAELDLSKGNWSVQLGIEDKDEKDCQPTRAIYDDYTRVVD